MLNEDELEDEYEDEEDEDEDLEEDEDDLDLDDEAILDDEDDELLDGDVAADELDVDDEELGDTEDEEDEDEDDDEDGPALASDDDGDQASLDQLLDARAARRGDDSEEEADIMALVADRDEVTARLTVRATPIRDRQEFVCSRCHLVKPRVQLADEKRILCRDCV